MSIDPAAQFQGPGIQIQSDDTGPLARDFQDLLSADRNGGRPVVTITLAQNGGTLPRDPSALAKPIVITAVNGHDRPSGSAGGADPGAGPDLRAPEGGPVVITAVHGEQPTALPDVQGPRMMTITAVTGGASAREPAVRVITTVHGDGQPTALPDVAEPRVVTITAVSGGASPRGPALRIITVVHGSGHPDAATPPMTTITAVNRPD